MLHRIIGWRGLKKTLEDVSYIPNKNVHRNHSNFAEQIISFRGSGTELRMLASRGRTSWPPNIHTCLVWKRGFGKVTKHSRELSAAEGLTAPHQPIPASSARCLRHRTAPRTAARPALLKSLPIRQHLQRGRASAAHFHFCVTTTGAR